MIRKILFKRIKLGKQQEKRHYLKGYNWDFSLSQLKICASLKTFEPKPIYVQTVCQQVGISSRSAK